MSWGILWRCCPVSRWKARSVLLGRQSNPTSYMFLMTLAPSLNLLWSALGYSRRTVHQSTFLVSAFRMGSTRLKLRVHALWDHRTRDLAMTGIWCLHYKRDLCRRRAARGRITLCSASSHKLSEIAVKCIRLHRVLNAEYEKFGMLQ